MRRCFKAATMGSIIRGNENRCNDLLAASRDEAGENQTVNVNNNNNMRVLLIYLPYVKI